MPERVRVGIIGAGNFTCNRMLPGFQKLPDVELTVVANRSRASGENVAGRFGIPHVASDYREVLDRADVDAVLIGTPPYLHLESTLAALDAGKHVLCQTRIARTTEEAREMALATDQARERGIKSMLVPPAPFGRGSRFVQHLVQSGYLGKLRQVLGFNMNATFADPNTPLSAGRNDPELYGRHNAMQLGLSYDVMAQWTGHATSVVAQRANFVFERPLTPDGPMARNEFPDEITVISDTESGAIMQNLVNYSVHFSDPRIELYGEKGTVVYKQRGDVILAGQEGGGTEAIAGPAGARQPLAGGGGVHPVDTGRDPGAELQLLGRRAEHGVPGGGLLRGCRGPAGGSDYEAVKVTVLSFTSTV